MGKNNSTINKPDGRRLRSDRSCQLILESMITLIHEGNLQPTAQQVADHANVGIRSVFRHFEDMETIFKNVDRLVRKQSSDLYAEYSCTGNLSQRITLAVERTAKIYETFSNMLLSGRSRYWNSPTVQKNYANHQNGICKSLQQRLPEIDDLSPEIQQSIFAVTSFEFWYQLRHHQQQSIEQSSTIMENLVVGLIGSN